MMTMKMMIMRIYLFQQFPSSHGLQSELRPHPDDVDDVDNDVKDVYVAGADADVDDHDENVPQPSPQEAGTRHHKQSPSFKR